MESILPVNIDDLLHRRRVEGNRIEFKASWNEGPTAEQVLRTICAFANDYLEINGGYIVLGVEERSGIAVLPPRGLDPHELTAIQKSIRGQSRRIEPPCAIIPSHEVVGDRHLLVLWVPASEDRPHRVPESRQGRRKYYIRHGAETVEARDREIEELIRRKGRTPFDDRPAPGFHLEDLRSTLVREFLREIGSALLDEQDDAEIYRRLLLTARMNGREVPRNVALMFFSDDPERAFHGAARIEVVLFGAGGDVLEEQTFRGPLHQQLRDCVRSLRQRVSQRVEKTPDRAESESWVSYPLGAIEEAVGNAVHHRSYEHREPTKVYIYDDRMEITSYPGPVAGLEVRHFEAGARPPQVPARNRRIGELLKELRLVETRGTGIGKIHRAMAENGSPPPHFEFDEERTYFRVVLPIHPKATPRASHPRPVAARDGLVIVSIGAESIQPAVQATLPDLELSDARVLIDHSAPDYLDAEPERFEAEAKRIRNALREPIEDPAVARLHLFYRGPVAMAPLLGAMLAAASKPVVVYHYHDGRYAPAYTLDRRFLKARD